MTTIQYIFATLIVFCFALLASPATADSLVVNNVTYPDVRVASVKDGEIIFSIGNSSNEIRKPLAQVTRINLADEPAFSAAEDAYAAKDYDKATEAYDKTFRTTQKTWLKDWVSLRLVDSANKAGRFDSAIKAYIALADKSPDAARAFSLTMPKPDSAYLTDAIKQVNSAVVATKKDATKQTLLSLLAQLNEAKGDLKAASDALTASAQVNTANQNTAQAARSATLLKLQTMTLALAAKDYDKVIASVEKDAASFTEPADFAEALFCLAEAKAGKAATSKDPDTWKEVAVAYMRIVANSPSSASQVPMALMRTAAIHETKLNEKDTALHIYEQIAAEYKGLDPAKQAEKEVQRLKPPVN
jgi:tetratricopeptide (TPR) repeat protein